jgi:tetratricopeptide (TPR) repeat protein
VRTSLRAGVGDLPLVGREQELALIAERFDQVRRDGGRVLLVAGEPGIGKSRLMAEGVDRARALGWRTLQAACYAHTSTTPYAPWLPLLEQLLELDGEAGATKRRQAVLDRVGSLAPEMSEQAPLLGPLLGLAIPHTPLTRALDQTSRRRSLLRLVATLFERAAALGPVAIAIEDLQWADESSLDMLEAVTSAASSSAPLLFLVSARPAGIERLRLPPERTTRIELSPLKQDAAAQLLEAAAGVTRVPKALSELLYARTAGNPLFLEEMARTLGQSDVFDRLEGASSVAAVETISQLDFPDRVQTLLMARIDRLDAPARSTLCHAAVIGQVFDLDALAALERPAGAAAGDVPADVSRLEQLGLFVPAAGDGGTYRFRHALLQEVAYGSLRFDRRRALHHQLAHYLEQHLGATEDARLDEVTHHYRRSGDRPKTFRYAVRSAVRARDIYATREAIDYYRIAFDSEPSRSADGAGVRSVLLEQLGDAYQLMGCHRDAIGAYRDALGRWKRVEDRSPSLEALHGLLPDVAPGDELHATLCHKIAACYERESRRYDRADHWIAEALAHLPGSPSSLPARVYSTQGIVRMRQGRYNASIRSCERAAAHARSMSDDSELAWALNTLSSSYAALGHLETAITVQQRSVTLLRKVGDLRRLSAAYGNLANCYMQMGDMEQALSHNREALAIETRIGAADGAAATSANIGEIEVLLGRFEAAIEHLDSALETSKDAGSDGMSGFVLTNLSRAHAGSGDLASARTSIDEAVELLTRAGMPGTLAEASIQQADVTRLEGRPADALPLCARALQDLARIGERTTRIVGLRVKGEALAALGRRAEAARALNESISLAREIGASLQLTRSVAAREGLEAEGRTGTA